MSDTIPGIAPVQRRQEPAPARRSWWTKTLRGVPLPVPHRSRMQWSWVFVAPGRVMVQGRFDSQECHYFVATVAKAQADVETLNSGGWVL